MFKKSRIELLRDCENDGTIQHKCIAKCKLDIVFWFNTFCWTFNPNQTPSDLPFVLYPFQEFAARDILEGIQKREDIGIEKSRDMGVSWLVMLVFQYLWLFHPGNNFHIGSRKEDFVDKKGDVSTLLGKFRYNLSKLPYWMLPVGFEPNEHDTYMKMINPENGNIITGESSNPHFGRAGRYTAILLDEFAFWPDSNAVYGSCSASTNSRIIVSTPFGATNRFAYEMHKEENDVRTFKHA